MNRKETKDRIMLLEYEMKDVFGKLYALKTGNPPLIDIDTYIDKPRYEQLKKKYRDIHPVFKNEWKTHQRSSYFDKSMFLTAFQAWLLSEYKTLSNDPKESAKRSLEFLEYVNNQ